MKRVDNICKAYGRYKARCQQADAGHDRYNPQACKLLALISKEQSSRPVADKHIIDAKRVLAEACGRSKSILVE